MLSALVRIRTLEIVTYRAEFLLWIVTLTMPMVMLALWRAVAQEGTFNGYTQEDFNAYYFAVLATTLMTGCNSVWEINEDICSGKLSFWLLRPIHPFFNYFAITLSELLMRLPIALPILWLASTMRGNTEDQGPAHVFLCLLAWMGGLLINQFIHLLIGSLGFWIGRSLVVFKAYTIASTILSGYMFPLAFLPDGIERVATLLPFRFVIALPVETLIGKLTLVEATGWVAVQWTMTATLGTVAYLVWHKGVSRYMAFG